MLDSRVDTVGCPLCVAIVADEGRLTLRLRIPDYLVIPKVLFAYGHEQVLGALGGNAGYVAYRRQHDDKAARASNLGQAISYKFKRDSKGWRVFVSAQVAAMLVVTAKRRGAVGIELKR